MVVCCCVGVCGVLQKRKLARIAHSLRLFYQKRKIAQIARSVHQYQKRKIGRKTFKRHNNSKTQNSANSTILYFFTFALMRYY